MRGKKAGMGAAGLLIMAVLLFLDQWTKALSIRYLRGQDSIILIPGVLELKYLENRGMAFGLLEGKRLLFLGFGLLFFLLIGYVYWKTPPIPRYYPLVGVLTLIGAGALGNFMDRLFRGCVVDFIYFSLIDFPIFNLADTYVVSGGILMVLIVCFMYREEELTFLLPGGKSAR